MQQIDRTRRVSEVLRRELSTLISRELNDTRIRNVTINAVTVSKDLKNATVYISCLETGPEKTVKATSTEGKKKQPSIEQLLNNAASFLRRMLSQNVHLRITPNIVFKYDDSIQRGVEMSSLIDSLNKKHESE
jgi:ribosome-binding factor A